jgi:NAD(P)-dependent dehydrogenase (short-subunit alcohol dehydrogenase family)
MSSSPSHALIVGASRGLGLALAAEYLKRGWRVTATARGPSQGLDALAAANRNALTVERVDIDKPDQVAALRQRLDGQRFDLLFVNAGVSNDNKHAPIGEVAREEFIRLMVTNAYSPMQVIERFESLVAPGGVIGAMSSGLGSIADNERGGWDIYRASKAALNMLMRSYAVRHRDRALAVIAPGWVRTDMGGAEATLGIEDSIPRVVDTLLGRAGQPGLRYLDYQGQTVRW